MSSRNHGYKGSTVQWNHPPQQGGHRRLQNDKNDKNKVVTLSPTKAPTKDPTQQPTREPTREPTRAPITDGPTMEPTASLTDIPSVPSTQRPTRKPTQSPTYRSGQFVGQIPLTLSLYVPEDIAQDDEWKQQAQTAMIQVTTDALCTSGVQVLNWEPPRVDQCPNQGSPTGRQLTFVTSNTISTWHTLSVVGVSEHEHHRQLKDHDIQWGNNSTTPNMPTALLYDPIVASERYSICLTEDPVECPAEDIASYWQWNLTYAVMAWGKQTAPGIQDTVHLSISDKKADNLLPWSNARVSEVGYELETFFPDTSDLLPTDIPTTTARILQVLGILLWIVTTISVCWLRRASKQLQESLRLQEMEQKTLQSPEGVDALLLQTRSAVPQVAHASASHGPSFDDMDGHSYQLPSALQTSSPSQPRNPLVPFNVHAKSPPSLLSSGGGASLGPLSVGDEEDDRSDIEGSLYLSTHSPSVYTTCTEGSIEVQRISPTKPTS